VYLIVALVLLGLLGYWRFRTTPFNWTTFAANFHDVNWSWAVAAIVFILLTYGGRAIRWAVMMKPLNAHLPFPALFSCTLIGFTAVVLSGRPGEFVRPYLISKRAGVPVSTQIAAWMIERILDLIMVALIFGVALSQTKFEISAPTSRLELILQTGGWTIGLLAAASLVVLLGFRHLQGPVQQRISDALTVLPVAWHRKVDGFLKSFAHGMEALRSPSAIAMLMVYSILEWFLIGLAYYASFHAFPATSHLSIINIVVLMGFISFGAVVQIPGIGGGLQVAAVFVLTELYQLTFEEASGIAMALWLVNYVSVVPLGLFFAFREGLNWKNIRNIEEEVGEGSSFRQL
jgi:uncharacterized protein (TIRG00374 family)